jgi:K+-sensing histidine kinase KdpD
MGTFDPGSSTQSSEKIDLARSGAVCTVNNEQKSMAQWKRVVVGVDGSEESKRALQLASEEASENGAELLVVSVWTPPPPQTAPPFASVPWGADTSQLAENPEAMLQKR